MSDQDIAQPENPNHRRRFAHRVRALGIHFRSPAWRRARRIALPVVGGFLYAVGRDLYAFLGTVVGGPPLEVLYQLLA